MVATSQIKEIGRLLRKEQQQILTINGNVKKINKTHAKLRITSIDVLKEKCANHAAAAAKLKEQYEEALATTGHEIEVLRELIKRLEKIAGITRAEPTKKRRTVGPPVEKELATGDTVVAYVNTGMSMDYVLCQVNSVDGSKAILLDLDTEPGAEQKKYEVAKSEVYSLNTGKSAKLPVRTRVIALFPGTTAFYYGDVVALPTEGNFYHIHFDDDVTETQLPIPYRQVEAKYVLPAPKRKDPPVAP